MYRRGGNLPPATWQIQPVPVNGITQYTEQCSGDDSSPLQPRRGAGTVGCYRYERPTSGLTANRGRLPPLQWGVPPDTRNKSFPVGEAFVPGFGVMVGNRGVFCAKKGHPLVLGGCPGSFRELVVLLPYRQRFFRKSCLRQTTDMLLYNRCVYLRLHR